MSSKPIPAAPKPRPNPSVAFSSVWAVLADVDCIRAVTAEIPNVRSITVQDSQFLSVKTEDGVIRSVHARRLWDRAKTKS